MQAVASNCAALGVLASCEAVGLPRATWYRSQARTSHEAPGSQSETRPRVISPRALSGVERRRVLELVHEPRFVDRSVSQVWASALDEGTYLCSQRTMYRILGAQGEVRERRDQLRRPAYTKPELLATGPNQVWTWDITKLKGPKKWNYFHLYVILDIFSRKVVGWMVAPRESAALAKRLIGGAPLRPQRQGSPDRATRLPPRLRSKDRREPPASRSSPHGSTTPRPRPPALPSGGSLDFLSAAVGPWIRSWVNGVPAADHFDPLDLEGFLALQVHSGTGTDLSWRGLRLWDLGRRAWEVLEPSEILERWVGTGEWQTLGDPSAGGRCQGSCRLS